MVCVLPVQGSFLKNVPARGPPFSSPEAELEQPLITPPALASRDSDKETFIDTNYGQGLRAAFIGTSSVLWLMSSEKPHNKLTFIWSH